MATVAYWGTATLAWILVNKYHNVNKNTYAAFGRRASYIANKHVKCNTMNY